MSFVKNSIPLKKASASTPDYMKVTGYFRKDTGPKETPTTYDTLPSISGLKSKASGKNVTLTWNGISAEDMLNLNSDESFGSLGYDIYVKDGSSGTEVYVGTTTDNKYTHTTSYNNPIYVVYTAYANYKANRSKGVEAKISIAADFDVKVPDGEIKQGELFTDNKPIIVLYSSIDVTDDCKIETISNTVDTSKPGVYEIKYKITYEGSSKIVSRKITVKATSTTSTTTTSSTKTEN